MSISQCTAFALRREPPPHPKLALADPPPAPVALTEKYRPRLLSEIVGQGGAVYRLSEFCEAPYPTAFLFSGPTGTGKTTAALALANELGVNQDWALHRVASGMMDAEAVESTLRMLRFSAPGGGWRLVVVDEADSMSPKAKQLWLSILEDIPPRAVIVLTTNHPEKFEARFLDRFERIPFAGDAGLLMQDAETLARSIWAAEGLPGCVSARSLPGVVEKGQISFRRVVQAVQAARFAAPRPRSCAVPRPPADTPAPPAPTSPAASPAPTMRALSVPQPYAWAIVHGDRRVEVRKWRTHHRGPLAIHAGLSRAGSKVQVPGMPAFADLPFGALVGVVTLDDCAPDCKGNWSWTMSGPRPIEPVPCPGGRGGFFDVDAAAIREIPESSDKST